MLSLTFIGERAIDVCHPPPAPPHPLGPIAQPTLRVDTAWEIAHSNTAAFTETPSILSFAAPSSWKKRIN